MKKSPQTALTAAMFATAAAAIGSATAPAFPAKIKESLSTADSQLWEFALEAAKRSRFSADASAPAQQQGEIVYRFIRQ